MVSRLGERRAPHREEAGWEAMERSSGPPSFCRWGAILGVIVMSLLATCMVMLGSAWPMAPRDGMWLMFHGVGLGLFCTYCVCAFRGVMERLDTRQAWILAWVIVILAALGFSYLVGLVSGVLGAGPSPEAHGAFVLRSTLAAGIVSLALFRYLFIRASWQAEMLAESEARVEALQARIRPHFLFNSLNTIASLIHDDPAAAERATEDLAALFRGGMRNNDDLVPLADELALARKYLAMEERRLGDRLTVEWRLHDLPAQEPVLPMLLQPLLENAVAHGIQPRPEGGVVSVTGRLEKDDIVITVRNPLAPSGSKPGQGMALRNIRSRLALAYSSLASLITHQDDTHHYAVLTLPHAAPADR
jgi:two-component system sensor histidine kinase AlgZ